jgi:hypothetical protein
MTSIYTKLREAVERSRAVNNLVMGDYLVAELICQNLNGGKN